MKFSLLTGASARWKLFTSVAAVVFVLDQWTKYLAVGHLTLAFHSAEGESLGFFQRLGRFLSHEHPVPHNTQTVLENFWHFRYVENPGAAWGLLGSAAEWFRTPFFLLVSMIAMVFIVQYFRRSEPHQSILRMALALVFGGAVGNFADRVRLGYVIDFIDWHWYDKATWPTFNVADSAITVGVILLMLEMFLQKPNGDGAVPATRSTKTRVPKADVSS